jgi:hypothetical protein
VPNGSGAKRTCASSAWSTADWWGVVSVRVRFFFSGATGGGEVSEYGLIPSGSSVSAIPLCESEEWEREVSSGD